MANELERRVQKLETYFKIAFGVAAVFGISGAFVFSSLSKVNAEIDVVSASIGDAERQIEAVKKQAAGFQDRIGEAERHAVEVIKGTGDEQKNALLRLLEGIRAEDLAQGALIGTVRDVLIRDCGDHPCPCPDGWERAKNVGGNADLNRGAEGAYIYLCVQRH